MKELITQAELARRLDLSRARIRQLVKEGVITFADPVKKLVDADYAVYLYRDFAQARIENVERNRSIKFAGAYEQVRKELEAELRDRLNSAFTNALPDAMRQLGKITREASDKPAEIIIYKIFWFVLIETCQKVMAEMTGAHQLDFADNLFRSALERALEQGSSCCTDEGLEELVFTEFCERI